MKGLDAEPSIDKEEAIEKFPKTRLSGVAAFMESMEEEKTRRGVGRHAARLRALSPKMAYALIDSRDEVRSCCDCSSTSNHPPITTPVRT